MLSETPNFLLSLTKSRLQNCNHPCFVHHISIPHSLSSHLYTTLTFFSSLCFVYCSHFWNNYDVSGAHVYCDAQSCPKAVLNNDIQYCCGLSVSIPPLGAVAFHHQEQSWYNYMHAENHATCLWCDSHVTQSCLESLSIDKTRSHSQCAVGMHAGNLAYGVIVM